MKLKLIELDLLDTIQIKLFTFIQVMSMCPCQYSTIA